MAAKIIINCIVFFLCLLSLIAELIVRRSLKSKKALRKNKHLIIGFEVAMALALLVIIITFYQ